MAKAKVIKTTKPAVGTRGKSTAAAKPRPREALDNMAPPGKPRTPAGGARSLPAAATAVARSLPGADSTGMVDVDQVLASVAAARTSLVAIQTKLNSISEAALDKLPAKDQEKWADQLAATDDAITKLDTVALKTINDDFADRVPELEQKTAALARSLQKINDVVDIIASVGKVIQIVTDIASLIR